jgi:hypothetical protein
MRLDDERPSQNIEDRRGIGAGMGFPRGGRRVRIPVRVGGRRGGIGLGGLLLMLAVAWFLGINPLALLTGGDVTLPQPEVRNARVGTGTDDPGRIFVAKVLGTTERTWERLFPRLAGRPYEPPRLVLFTGAVRSACGMAGSAMGPFYCPLDRKVYIDLSFYEDMRRKLGAGGDFAQAYVIAHEVGHHVQNLLGIAEKVMRAWQRLPRAQANRLSVRMELQADCLAGVWGHDNRHLLEEGDLEEALNAAAAIGDDRLQRRSQGYVVPDAFTHGTSEQRVRWFRRGFESGDPRACDTFAARRL